MASSRRVGGRGKCDSLDLARELVNDGLSDQQVREILRSSGFRNSRISQLLKDVSPPSIASVRKGKTKSRSISQDLVKMLHNQGLSDERVRSRLRLRGFKKARISQLMKTIVAKRSSLISASSTNSTRARPTQPVKAAVRVQSAVKPAKNVFNSIDIEEIIKAELNKKAPPLVAGHVGTVSGMSHRPLARGESRCKPRSASVRTRTAKSLKRTRLHPKEDDADIENVVRAKMMRTAKSDCATNTGVPAETRSDVGTQANRSALQEKEPIIGSDELAIAAGRINGLRREQFPSMVDWAFAVLCQPARDVPSVQRAYRTFMRRLHPDKAGAHPAAGAAVELLREAASICEIALSHQQPPSRPTELKFSCICAEAGKRQVKVVWTAPNASDSAPIHKYIVAVLDPTFGKVLTIATLETDYSKELGRFLVFDDPEFCSHVISEEHLRKMPKLFKVDSLIVHVAAANREGQSDWSKLKICLSKLKTSKRR